ncbi:MAG: ArsR/SmtB family transcription factor [Promethearchaeota archaeon]
MTKPEIEITNGEVSSIFKALSSKTRWKILKLLKKDKKLDISRIAEALNQTEANISAQVKILEKAGLIMSHYEPGERGVRKICEPACEKLIIQIIKKE